MESLDKLKKKEYFFLLDFISKFPKKIKVVDMGCGDGKLVGLLRERDYDAWGVEIGEGDPTMYPFGNVVPRNVILKEDMRKTNFEDKSIDIVYSLDAVKLVGFSDYGTKDYKEEFGDASAVKEFQRILKEDGRILITLSYGEPGIRRKIETKRSYRVYDDERIKKIFEGLEIEEEHYFFWDEGTKEWKETKDKNILRKIFTKDQLNPLGQAFFILKKLKGEEI